MSGTEDGDEKTESSDGIVTDDNGRIRFQSLRVKGGGGQGSPSRADPLEEYRAALNEASESAERDKETERISEQLETQATEAEKFQSELEIQAEKPQQQLDSEAEEHQSEDESQLRRLPFQSEGEVKQEPDAIEDLSTTYADRLAKAGIETKSDMSAADADTVAETAEVSEEQAKKWIEQANR